jgi:hypothetical protein
MTKTLSKNLFNAEKKACFHSCHPYCFYDLQRKDKENIFRIFFLKGEWFYFSAHFIFDGFCSMKSVLFISLMNGGAWGGSEELWYQTALYAAKHGYRVGCAFYEWPQKSSRIEQLQKAGLPALPVFQ